MDTTLSPETITTHLKTQLEDLDLQILNARINIALNLRNAGADKPALAAALEKLLQARLDFLSVFGDELQPVQAEKAPTPLRKDA